MDWFCELQNLLIKNYSLSLSLHMSCGKLLYFQASHPIPEEGLHFLVWWGGCTPCLLYDVIPPLTTAMWA